MSDDTLRLTLVAFYGEKPSPLDSVIETLQSEISTEFGAAFVPYSIEQVHATLIGLESEWCGGRWRNVNFHQHRSVDREPDFDGLVDFVRSSGDIPLRGSSGWLPGNVVAAVSESRCWALRTIVWARARSRRRHGLAERRGPVPRDRRCVPAGLSAIRRASQVARVSRRFR